MESRAFKFEGERNDHMLHYEQVFGNVFERKKSKYYAVLMKHHHKVKGEQVSLSEWLTNYKPKIPTLYQDNYFVASVKLNFGYCIDDHDDQDSLC